MKKAALHNLGCKVNAYETEAMQQMLEEAGYEIVPFSEKADVYVINTCSVTNMADRKSRQMLHRAKKRNPDAAVVAAGCYVQTKEDEAKCDEAIDILIGNNQKKELVERLDAFFAGRGEKVEAVVDINHEKQAFEELTLDHAAEHTRAFIKVQDGCNQFCSYCIIPYARGKVRSRALKEVTEEARNLVAAGFKEIVLTGINTALYGQDWKEEDGLSGVEKAVAAISAIEGDFRIRLSSLEPNVVDEETARRLTAYPKLCPHMHLSLQSGSDTVLRRMNRRYDVETYRRIVDVFRQFDPEFAVTTDIIAGFPGETEEEFEESLETIRRIGFSKVHAFKYSMRDGTRAAQMPDQISGNVKSLRVERMMELAEREANRFFERNIGKVRQVLFERYDEKTSMLTGFTDNYIHTCCRMPREQAEKFVNGFSDVLLKEIREGGLEGEIV